MNVSSLNKLLGNIDIYLLDQILKGRFTKDMRILDAGCGEGRNLIYLLQENYQVFGVDQNPTAIQMVRTYARSLQPQYDLLRFQVASVEDLPFHQGAFQAIISSAVLHFAKNTGHFHQMFDEMLRVVEPGGILFLRMTTGFGEMEKKAEMIGDGVYNLPDGSSRFLLTEKLLETVVEKHRLSYLENPKSVLVHGQRAMGVFVFEKG
ncbi:class I SAM-dependent methyltransferase [Echinicola sp. CAU 1574]|uniref:Class I SAM-dependent methyltransferase n=1 Tax=Echinicola arenosa TaxID=2774144 RepID=A0ABR9AMA6_9BACT|nr:class I SAM-dependent methyltransferase [Echinicola arenosa]MBD8488764.1 class I SAM-dependent methyltransferase [Echinicola arenosa]